MLVSGSVMTKDYGYMRKFIETFFLAPQEKGYFVLNDIFQVTDEPGILYRQLPTPLSSENIYRQHPAPLSSDDTLDTQLNASSPPPEPTGNMMIMYAVHC